ncbi:MAG TPA: hypothetical protein VFI95_20420 [Terriglobales bacterium]|jgi:hypothetical protein|nr:hypothetical protein [Terriglobales bacterium]
MSVTFRPNILWPSNDLLLPAQLFKVKVPPGLSSFYVRDPNFVDVTKMMQLAKEDKTLPSGTLTMTNGLVTADLKVRFANPSAQWRRSSFSNTKDPNRGPFQYQFTGGDVFLDLVLSINLLKSVDYDPDDDLSVQIFARIYEHELLHVVDEVDIVNSWLVPRLNSDPTVARYLVRGEPYTYGTPSMVVTQVEREFQAFIDNTIQVAIFNVWATESNRREALRDAPAQYKIVQDKVDELRIRQINRPQPAHR